MDSLSGDRILPSSQACLEYVQQNYVWEEVSQKIKQVYQSVLS
ncbi:MAG: hypothetical protein WBM44_26870 [Waterburya sp.]